MFWWLWHPTTLSLVIYCFIPYTRDDLGLLASIGEVTGRELQTTKVSESPSCLILQPRATTQPDTSDSLQTVYTRHAEKSHCFSLFLSHSHILLHEVSGELLLLCCSPPSLFNEASLGPSLPFFWLDCWVGKKELDMDVPLHTHKCSLSLSLCRKKTLLTILVSS